MQIKVAGFDPSLTHWGIAEATLSLDGYLSDPQFTLVEPDKLTNKQVRQNSSDLHVAEQLARTVLEVGRRSKVVFVECPVGSQSARAMASYGVCVGILGALRAEGVQLIEVTPTEVKKCSTGLKNATKEQMINWAVDLYPGSNWPRYTKNGQTFKKGDIMKTAEHVADAVGAIHAGVHTPTFQNLLRLLQG